MKKPQRDCKCACHIPSDAELYALVEKRKREGAAMVGIDWKTRTVTAYFL